MSAAEFRTITQSESLAGHLSGCFDALYGALGASAPRLGDDACVVALHECARAMGEVRNSFVDLLAHRDGVDATRALARPGVIGDVLYEAVEREPSGTLSVYLFTMVLAPRLLISLRDVVESAAGAADGALRQRAQDAANKLVGEMRRVSDVVRQVPFADEHRFRAAANDLEERVCQAGYGESFGTGTTG